MKRFAPEQIVAKLRQADRELFDLALDPWETTNRIADSKYAEIAASLKKQIADWDKNTDHAEMYPVVHVSKKKRGR